jgi:hypothetical protein
MVLLRNSCLLFGPERELCCSWWLEVCTRFCSLFFMHILFGNFFCFFCFVKMDQLKCSLCGSMVELDFVAQHVCHKTILASAPSVQATGRSTPLMELPLDCLEDELRLVYKSPVMMEEASGEDNNRPRPVSFPSDSTLYHLTKPGGVRAGFAAKQGANFTLYDTEGAVLKRIRGRLIETKQALVSDLQEEEGLTLLCKVCQGRVPVDLVEKHAKSNYYCFHEKVVFSSLFYNDKFVRYRFLFRFCGLRIVWKPSPLLRRKSAPKKKTEKVKFRRWKIFPSPF